MNRKDFATIALAVSIGVAITAAALTWTAVLDGDARPAASAPAPYTTPDEPTIRDTPSVPPPARPVAPAAPQIGDGAWTVGLDFPAGQYRPKGAAPTECYWEISKAGTGGAEILQNDYGTGGRPLVILRNGQGFTTRDCGTWVRIK